MDLPISCKVLVIGQLEFVDNITILVVQFRIWVLWIVCQIVACIWIWPEQYSPVQLILLSQSLSKFYQAIPEHFCLGWSYWIVGVGLCQLGGYSLSQIK